MQEKLYPKINEKLISETLANGLEIKIIPKPGFSKAYAQLSVNYGSIDAAFDAGEGIVIPPKGVAHFLEHKVFEQPDGGNALATFAQTGASPNAFTSKTMTAYHFSSTEKFDRNLEILLDFVTTPYFTDENVAKEQGIIGQEIGMVNDRPHFKVYENLHEALFCTHPARDSIIGTVESIGQITRKVLDDCYRTFYIPSNMVLTVAGDVDPSRVIDTAEAMLVKKYIAPPKRDYGVEPEVVAKREICEKAECSLPIFAFGFKKKLETRGKSGMLNRLYAELACDLLFGESSQLYSDAYRDGVINTEFCAETAFYPGVGIVAISGESRDPDEVLSRVMNVSKSIDDNYFKRVICASLGARLREFDSFGSVCRSVASAHFAGYDYFDIFEAFEKIEKRDIMNFIADMFSEDNLAISKILPLGGEGNE